MYINMYAHSFILNISGKHVIGWAMFITMVASVLTPLSASVSPYMVVAVRVVQGLGQVSSVFSEVQCL